MVALQQDFDEFGKRLKAVEEQDAKEVQEIRGIKARIERKLRSVMCRTERAFFVRDGQGAVDPRFTKTAGTTEGRHSRFQERFTGHPITGGRAGASRRLLEISTGLSRVYGSALPIQ